MIFQLSQ